MLGRVVFTSLLSVVLAQNDTSWQKYIVGPQVGVVYPKDITSFAGDVQNPTGLLPGGQGDTILSRSSNQEPAEIIVDFGLNTVGYLNIDFNGASENTPGIRLAFSETLQFLSDLSDYSRSNAGNTITPGSDQIAVGSSPYTWTDSNGCSNGNQVCSDGLHGFRYVKIYLDALDSDAPITAKTGSVNIASVSLNYTAFIPTPDSFQGFFESSDEQLNQFWYAGVYTNDLITDTFRASDVDPRGAATPGLEGLLVLHDGAKRDRDPYVGDVAVSGRTAYLSHGSFSSVGANNVMADLGDHQRDDGYIPPASILGYTLPLFDYPLWWVVSIWEYTLYTGDTALVGKYYPNIVRVFEDFYRSNTSPGSSLIARPAGMGDFAFVGRDGEVAYYNALYVLALKAGVECANYVGDTSSAASWTERADAVSAAINEVFWDESVGAYKNDRNATSHPQDGNSIAILAGVADYDRAHSVLNYLSVATSRPYGNAFMDDDSLVGGGSQRVYAFISTFEIRARFEQNEADATDSALDEIRRLYGWMYTHDPNITFWEGIGKDGSMYEGAFTSAAHGWSTGVVGHLTNYILGLRPLTPGGATYLYAPVPSSLQWARGAAPTMYGPVEIGWDNSGQEYVMKINAPTKSKGTFVIPVDGAHHIVTHNGEEVWREGVALKGYIKANEKGHVVLDDVSGGEHIIKAIRC